MLYYRIAYLFFALGCYYFAVMGLRATIEIVSLVKSEWRAWRDARERERVRNPPDPKIAVLKSRAPWKRGGPR
jgi:predicted phosphoadenosine phosphosulfate sulfurtransferase